MPWSDDKTQELLDFIKEKVTKQDAHQIQAAGGQTLSKEDLKYLAYTRFAIPEMAAEIASLKKELAMFYEITESLRKEKSKLSLAVEKGKAFFDAWDTPGFFGWWKAVRNTEADFKNSIKD